MSKGTEIRIFGKKIFEVRSGTIQDIIRDNWASSIFGSMTDTGKLVNQETSQEVSAFYACGQLLGNSMAMVPLQVYKKDKNNNRIIASDDYRYSLLHSRPNKLMTSFTWRRSSQMQVAFTGNSYTYIKRNGFSGRAEELQLIPNPKKVKVFIYEDELYYDVNGQLGLQEPVRAENILHFKWSGTDGLVGKSPMAVARENIGQVIAMQKYGSKVFSQGGAKRVALKSPAKLTDSQKQAYQTVYNDKYSGVDNLHNLMILEGGGDIVEIGMSPEDAQFISIMKFKVEEIARIFNIPLHLIQSLDHATNNNIEQQGLQYVIYTMMPHYVNWEQELDIKLFEGSGLFTKFNMDALMRGDVKSRAMWYRAMQDLGNMSINEVRQLEDLNPIEGGDIHYVQVNRMPLQKLNDLDSRDMVKYLADLAVKRKNGHHEKIENN